MFLAQTELAQLSSAESSETHGVHSSVCGCSLDLSHRVWACRKHHQVLELARLMVEVWFKWDCSKLWDGQKNNTPSSRSPSLSEESDNIRGYDGAWPLALKSREKRGLICSKTLREKNTVEMGLWRIRLEHCKIFKGQQSAQCEIKPGQDLCLDLHTVWNSQKAGLSFTPLSSSGWATLLPSGDNLLAFQEITLKQTLVIRTVIFWY